MVLLPCARCCGCACPSCLGCCACETWQNIYLRQQYTPPAPGYTSSWSSSIYYDLADILPDCITRKYESQTECVDALVAQVLIDNPGMTEEEIRDIHQAYWEGHECQNYVSTVAGSWHGWSAPYLPGDVPATAAALAEMCPNGAPADWLCSPGATGYFSLAGFNGPANQIPDIRHLVIDSPGTGDWIADALLARGTLDDLPELGWDTATDCADCASPAVLEEDCDAVTDYKKFYSKTVVARDSWPNVCDYNELDFLCPPEKCRIVTITVTRTDQCSPNSPASPAVTEWVVELAICPCAWPFLYTPYSTPGLTVSGIYGYASEQDCIDDLTEENCLGGTPAGRCSGSQWQQVRHYTSGGSRSCIAMGCYGVCSEWGGWGCCT